MYIGTRDIYYKSIIFILHKDYGCFECFDILQRRFSEEYYVNNVSKYCTKSSKPLLSTWPFSC